VKDRLIDRFEYLSPPGSFREFLAENEHTLKPDDAAECWVAWFLDSRIIDGVESYDVNSGPIEDEWLDPAAA
jgi:hypothetical protein